jgi:hypothetical protein
MLAATSIASRAACDLRVGGLVAPLELGDRRTGSPQLLDDLNDLELDLAEDTIVGDGQFQQPARR